jgi:predicted 3-demethylubiquinone-9 3-methyltransferase (glyoxalase superfamily)
MDIATFLWFDGHAEEAAEFYTGTFPDSRILSVHRTHVGGPVMTVAFELRGQRFVAFNGGPQFSFTGAISLYVACGSQAELDAVWAGLVDGGHEGPGGSLVDRFGVTWQVMPTVLDELLQDADPVAADRILSAVHASTKIDIQELVDAGGQSA